MDAFTHMNVERLSQIFLEIGPAVFSINEIDMDLVKESVVERMENVDGLYGKHEIDAAIGFAGQAKALEELYTAFVVVLQLVAHHTKGDVIPNPESFFPIDAA